MNAGLALEAVDAFGAAAAEPAFHVLDQHPCVAPRALDGDRAVWHLDGYRVVVGVRHLLRRLPARADELLERVAGGLHVEDVRHPAADEALLGFPLLVGADRLAGGAIHLGVSARERGGHAADRHGAALEADSDETAEDVRQKRRGLDVDAEAVGPYLARIGHDELEDRRLEITAGRVK